jgi:hypothetical protein
MTRGGAAVRVGLVGLAVALAAVGRLSATERPGGGAAAPEAARPLPAALSAPDVISWAASRTHVVLARADSVALLDIASGAELRLPGVLAAPGEVRFSPRGDRVALSLRVGGAADVYLLDLAPKDGPRLHRLTLSGGGDPRWLGRGDRLLYQAPDGAGGFTLFVREEGGLGRAAPFWDERPAPVPEAATIS